MSSFALLTGGQDLGNHPKKEVSTMAYARVCSLAELSLNTPKRVKMGEESLLLVRLQEGVYALQRRCPHMGAPLDRAKVENGYIRCPLHRAEFDIASGKPRRWASFPPGIQLLNVLRKEKGLRTYPVKVENEEVFVDTGA